MADNGPITVVFGSSFPSPTKKKEKIVVKVGPPLTKLSGSAHADGPPQGRFARASMTKKRKNVVRTPITEFSGSAHDYDLSRPVSCLFEQI